MLGILPKQLIDIPLNHVQTAEDDPDIFGLRAIVGGRDGVLPAVEHHEEPEATQHVGAVDRLNNTLSFVSALGGYQSNEQLPLRIKNGGGLRLILVEQVEGRARNFGTRAGRRNFLRTGAAVPVRLQHTVFGKVTYSGFGG